ncbi:MAG: TetR family transcriptional regulator [Actinomycetota bacterium]|nr:TetR family transcriptional regulator [Actinomycetota bacterium]
MLEENNGSRNRIIKSAIKLIGIKGSLNITIREIAHEAKANVAAVNYYFCSKSILLKEIEEYFNREVAGICRILKDEKIPPKERILIWAKDYMNYLTENPGVIWTLGSKVLIRESISSSLDNFFSKIDVPLISLIKKITGIEDDLIVLLKKIQIISGIINPLLMYYGVGKDYGADFNDKDIRNIHVELLIKSILGC